MKLKDVFRIKSIQDFILGLLLGGVFSLLYMTLLENKMPTIEENSTVKPAQVVEETHSHSGPHLHVKSQFKNPTVKLFVSADTMGGFNLEVKTNDFKWVPEKAGDQIDAFAMTEGHAHVYVNGVKIGRLYGEWLYIPKTYFVPGKNIITVSLNGNNHLDWYSSDDTYQIKGEVEVNQK